MIDLDFSNTRDKDVVLEEMYSPLPDGEYLMLVTDAQVKPSKDAEKFPSLKVVLTSVEDMKKNIWKWFYLDPANELSMANLKDFLEKLYKTTIEGSLTLDPTDMIGRQVIAILTIVPRNDDPEKFQNDAKNFIEVPF